MFFNKWQKWHMLFSTGQNYGTLRPVVWECKWVAQEADTGHTSLYSTNLISKISHTKKCYQINHDSLRMLWMYSFTDILLHFLWLVRTRQSLKSVHTTKVKIAVVQFSVCIFCLKCNSVIIRFSSLCKHVILFVYLSDMGFRSSFVCFLLAIGSFSSCIY